MDADRYEWGANEYQAYARELESTPELQLHYEDSVKFEHNAQLMELDLMTSSPALVACAAKG